MRDTLETYDASLVHARKHIVYVSMIACNVVWMLLMLLGPLLEMGKTSLLESHARSTRGGQG